jgi:hypothetical protein
MWGLTSNKTIPLKVFFRSLCEKHIRLVQEQNAAPPTSQRKVCLKSSFDLIRCCAEIT